MTSDASPLVSIIIPTRGSSGEAFGKQRTFVTEAVRSIVEMTTYENYEVVLVADTVTPEQVALDAQRALGARLRLIWYDRPFSFSKKMNLGAAYARGPYLLLLNDDVEVITPDWIETLLKLVERPGVGMVGATLLFEDGTLQHAGHHYGQHRAIGHVAYGTDFADLDPSSPLLADREASGVTAACALISADCFVAVGGFCPQLPVTFNDVDLSLKIRGAGLRILCTPRARLYHFETKSRQPGVPISEQDFVMRRWGGLLEPGDPYWPVNEGGGAST